MRVSVLFAALAAVAALPAAGQAAVENPCEGPTAHSFLCPNLRIGPPSDLYLDYSGGRALLRATSDVRSRGRGPMELRGTRDGRRTMRVRQRIYRAGGGHVDVPSRATLNFTDVGYRWGGSFWKVHQLARFELRRATPGGKLGPVLRTSPKLNYCLRDLFRTRPAPLAPEPPLPRLQPEPVPGPRHPGNLGRLVGHLPGRLRQAVDRRHRPARLLRLPDDRRSEGTADRVQREGQHLPAPGAPAVQRRRRLLGLAEPDRG